MRDRPDFYRKIYKVLQKEIKRRIGRTEGLWEMGRG
jgi:hypothetical protein